MLSSLIDQFCAHLAAGGYSPRTINTWRPLLRAYARYMGEDAVPESLTHASMRRYLESRSAAGLRPRTVRSVRLALAAWGRWLVSERILPANPADGLPSPKLDAARRDLVTDEEMRDLLAACDRVSPLRRSALARAVVSVLVYCGLRRSELLALYPEDVSLPEHRVLVRSGKGQKSRIVYACQDCMDAIRQYLRLRGYCTHPYLWDQGGRRLGQSGLKTLLEEVKAIAGYRGARNILPHSIRHNAATRYLQRTGDIDATRAFLGHSSIATTQVYLHTSEERQRDLAEATSLRVEEKHEEKPEQQRRQARRWIVERGRPA